MSDINIVLVEPQIPQNTGNIARTCAATGASLHLVKPMGFTVDDKKLKRAGLDYWHMLDITYYEGLDDFFEKNKGGNFFFLTTKGRHIFSDVSFPKNTFILFGREDAGLPEELLKSHGEASLRIPMVGDARSLNLSNTAAIVTYEILRQWGYPDLLCEGQLTKYSW
ncbi:MAG: tRNA (uridine(34)/cytosine(34)/5-carboxymethylaminomethyluridine(34)-2'-O)-methyltransferase TrmL [Ruminococcaceae bacterium]|nr:tRNA (uridine(34)/cytosine(34)/5-carboxymethylaminomethyluridine(34)-2'-O)-methyltransferase TrmL [Oscillospiraceae bacterium]